MMLKGRCCLMPISQAERRASHDQKQQQVGIFHLINIMLISKLPTLYLSRLFNLQNTNGNNTVTYSSKNLVLPFLEKHKYASNVDNSFINKIQFLQTILYMLSDIISVNSNAAINPEQHDLRIDTQQIVNINNSQYRVLSREFANKSSVVSFWCVFWMTANLVVSSQLVFNLQNLSTNTVFFALLFAGVIMVCFSIYQRKVLYKIMLLSIINFSLCAIVSSIFLIISLKYIIVPISASVLIQLVLSFAYIKKKGKVILQIILLGELVLIGLKADGLLAISWSQTLIILLPFFIFLAAASFFLLIYTFLLKRYYNQTYQTKKLSLLFMNLNFSSYTLALSIPLAHFFLDINTIVLSILAMAVISTNSIYLWINSQQITLDFCINKYEMLNSEKQMKIELVPVKDMKKNLYRLSDNWFGTQLKDTTINTLNSYYPQCLVCTQSSSDIVWLPCGHISLCTSCCKDVIQNRMINCILCKQKPTHICKIKERNQVEAKLDKQMGLAEPFHKNAECVIEQYQVRIS